nr:hypothetical protein CFP56_21628 [Quercus suber]
MQENMHITISVKDFKSIVTHAETLRTSLSCRFSVPRRPLQFSYHNFGIHSEFTLMTAGNIESTPAPSFVSTRSISRQPSVSLDYTTPSQIRSDMPPPTRPISKKPLLGTRQQSVLVSTVHEPPITNVHQDSDSLFVPGGDEDRLWDQPNYDEEDGEEMLGWDASGNHQSASFYPASHGNLKVQPEMQKQLDGGYKLSQEGLEPTQRLSQLHGMFD